jgi:hypothetical protein
MSSRRPSPFSWSIVTILAAIAVASNASAHGSLAGEGLSVRNASASLVFVDFHINHAMSDVDLCVYDVRGHRLATLVHGQIGAGDHRLEFSGRGHSAGVYFARLVTEHGTYVKKFVLRR